MADEIYVINVGGYIGDSTRSEIEYATMTGKAVKYLEEKIHLQNNPQMDLISLDAADGAHVFVKDRTERESPAVKCPVRFAKNDGRFLQGVFLTEQFHQFCVLTVFRMVYLDKADQAI